MTRELLCISIIGLAATGSLGLIRSAGSRDLNRGQEIVFWMAWAAVGSWLLVTAGLFLFLPFLGFVLLFHILSVQGETAVPRHLNTGPA